MQFPDFVDPNILPHRPGIYIYRDSSGEIIYVGKAIDLFNRVSSYFSGRPHNSKTSQLILNIASVETIIVESELEALILEANLIKKNLPLYNIRLTDDKDYLYIVVTDEEYPRIITARKTQLLKIKKWFGPYPSSKTVKDTLKKLRRVFPWCSNPPQVTSGKSPESRKAGFLDSYTRSGTIAKTRHRPCFYFHIGQCIGPCAGVCSREDYLRVVNMFTKFLEGKKEELIADLTGQMEKFSEEERYEEAQRMKKIIQGISYIAQPTGIKQYLENPNFVEDITRQGLEELQKVLGLPNFPERIEGYDISNFQGKESTGSMVVLTNGEIDKSQYRRFKIKITGQPNDVGMHKEMMGRRLKNDWPLPQLFLIDGGRGQVRGAEEEISNFKFLISKKDPEKAKQLEKIKVYGLAKREEWLYPPEGEVIKLPKRSLALRLLQKIRNESHRFAITYHRKLRAKAFGV